MHECNRVRGAESSRERVRERVGGEIETESRHICTDGDLTCFIVVLVQF